MSLGVQLTLLLLTTSLTLVFAPDRASAQAEPSLPPPPGMKFGAVDRKLMAEAAAVDQHLENEGLVCSNAAVEQQLEQLARPLLTDGGKLENVDWRFRILRDPVANAFSLPNGTVYVHSGLLGMLENKAQIAAILAHEIIHVRNRHAYLSFRSYRKKALAANMAGLGGVAAGVAAGGGVNAIRSIGAASQALLQYSVSGYSRELEREADVAALALLNRTRLDTRQFPRLFQLLGSASEAPPVPTFLSDHPALIERAKYMEAAIQARPTPGREGIDSEEYLNAFSRPILDDIQGQIDARRYRTAVLHAKRLADWRTDGLHFYWLGEAYRALGPRSHNPSTEEEKSIRSAARQRLTVSDEHQFLKDQPGGSERLQQSESMAEAAYQRAIALGEWRANRGLGLLYQRQSKFVEARAAFSKYLESVPDASDKIAIERRIADLTHR